MRIVAAQLVCSADPVTLDFPSESAHVTALSSPKCARRRVRRGDTLYGVGDPFSVLHIVRFGFFKSLTVSRSGLLQVTGFPMVGDVMGLGGIATGCHVSQVIALDNAEVYVLPFDQCEEWAQASAYSQRLMARTMACEIVRSQELMLMLAATLAEQRVAIFLVDMSNRYARLGYSPSQFVLRMTRDDIGSYLGLTLETVSRMLTRLEQQGTIRVEGKAIALLDHPALMRVSGTSADQRAGVAPILDRDGVLTTAG